MPKLTANQVKTLTKPGRYGDGRGLYLRVAPGGSKQWVLRKMSDGVRRDLGVGGYPKVSLAKARELAGDYGAAIAEEGHQQQQPTIPTFAEAVHALHSINAPRWKSEKHGNNWLQMMERHTFPALGDKPVDAIDRLDVLGVLTPIWTEVPETARRVKQRTKAVFDWAVSHGYRVDNPAGPVLDGALPPMPKVKEHFRALPHEEVGDALRLIAGGQSSLAAKYAVHFLVLTAARSGEVRGARWDEIDRDSATWTIPGGRMKTGFPHRVPLSQTALEVLGDAADLDDGSGLVFPSPVGQGRQLSDMTLTKIMRANGLAERATVHGFRSSFRDWGAEHSGASWDVLERCLAHQPGNTVERSYARSDLLEVRRSVMAAWATYLEGDGITDW